MDTSPDFEPNAPLPESEVVIRLISTHNVEKGAEGIVPETTFSLSSQDEKEAPPTLSVWASSLIEPLEARAFMDEPAKYGYYCTLPVGVIRSVASGLGLTVEWDLDALWVPYVGKSSDNPKTKAHAGIVRLNKRGLENQKVILKEIRRRLCDSAKNTFTIFPLEDSQRT